MEKVLISGASGLLGKAITEKLQSKGYEVLTLSRSRKNHKNAFLWNVDKGEIEEDAVINADYIIHLAGEGIADKKWTDKRKKQIIESRTKSTQLLLKAIKNTGAKIKAFVSASAVGYYGAVTSEKVFNENDLPAIDFLGQSCKAWEESVDKIATLGIRTVKFRIGVVLSKDGGALTKMAAPYKFYMGAVLGNGKQYIPWVHINDVANAFVFAIQNEQLNGSYNLTAPGGGVSNRQFSKVLAKVLSKPILLPPVPEFALKLLLGDMADLVLKGSRVSSKKLSDTGFKFEYDDLEMTVKSLLQQEK
ncbi:MAG: TIGR01777 family oxidoreductase [Bacteroidia bacterium]